MTCFIFDSDRFHQSVRRTKTSYYPAPLVSLVLSPTVELDNVNVPGATSSSWDAIIDVGRATFGQPSPRSPQSAAQLRDLAADSQLPVIMSVLSLNDVVSVEFTLCTRRNVMKETRSCVAKLQTKFYSSPIPSLLADVKFLLFRPRGGFAH